MLLSGRILTYKLIISLLQLLTPVNCWVAHFQPRKTEVLMKETAQVSLTLADIEAELLEQTNRYVFELQSSSLHLANVLVPENGTIFMDAVDANTKSWHGSITINARLIGEAIVTVRLHDLKTGLSTLPDKGYNDSSLHVTIRRPERVIDRTFLYSVILLMSLLYINFGAALDLQVLRGIITRPVAPCIGLVMQCIGMPLLSYALGIFIFPHMPAMQLGLFFTGIAPSGGASNTWSAVLGGNIHLSVLMTTISNVLALATMPLWIFTLGKLIFDSAGIALPYRKIATASVGLIVPLFIGLVVQKWFPRITRVLVRLLKPISAFLILFIIVFAIITNWYMFELFSWQIAVSGLALPGLGYTFSWVAAKLLQQNSADALTIAIETGIQNTGIAIFLLQATLEQPHADLTAVLPVAVAIMTPIPLLGIYVYNRYTAAKVVDVTMNGEDHRII